MAATGILAHLDDVGATAGSVAAWTALRKAGVVRSASVMVPCAWYRAAVDEYQQDPDQDLGIHITLTSEWPQYRWRPMIGPVKGLVDSEGFFHRRPEMVVAMADPLAVHDEICAQIERMLSDGITPTHIDAHMGTAFLPAFAPTLFDIGRRYGIGIPVFRDMSALIDIVRLDRVDPGFVRELVEEATLRREPVFDRFRIGFVPEGQAATPYYKALLSDCADGLTWFAIHANAPGDFAAIARHMAWPREQEFAIFSQPASAEIFPTAQSAGLIWQDVTRGGCHR